MEKHTPLPWYIHRGYDTNDAVGIGAHSKGPAGGWVGLHVADLPTGDAANANANAALIVRAVNAHEGLVKALAASKTWLDLFVDKLNLDPSETAIDVKAASPTGERILASKSLAEALTEIDAALKQSEGTL